jgi:hypothetical protein
MNIMVEEFIILVKKLNCICKKILIQDILSMNLLEKKEMSKI